MNTSKYLYSYFLSEVIQEEITLSEQYLAVAGLLATIFSAKSRDQYVPNGQMWVTESGDAGGGGNSWASTFMDVFRTLNEPGDFATVTDGIIFHNTLASSAYGFLEHGTFDPRPNYFVVLLLTRLMGETVVELLKEAMIYELSAKHVRSEVMLLNGRELVLGENNELPCLDGKKVSGKLTLAPATIAFIVL